MTPERLHEAERIFHGALNVPPLDREDFLELECRGDGKLRQDVESLLACADAAPHFLEPATLPAEQEFAPGAQVDQYRLEKCLASGGMGHVWIAFDDRLQRRIALKVLPAAFVGDATAGQRFHREALAASALNHPGICTIYGTGEWRGRPYLAMEWIEGESLQSRLQSGPLPASELVILGQQIAAALQSAHDKGIIHRDIKPANIVVTEDGRAKIVDFGIARPASDSDSGEVTRWNTAALQPRVTGPGLVTGTLAYMSPEQTRGERLDARSDLYSLGATLYELATGHPPFADVETRAVLHAIQTRVPPPPSALAVKLPRRLEALILRLLSKHPADRYGSAAEVEAELILISKRGTPAFTRSSLAATACALVVAVIALFAPGHKHPAPQRSRPVPRQVTANPMSDPVPRAAISPDGTKVAYVDLTGLHIAEVNGGKVRTVLPPPGCCFR